MTRDKAFAQAVTLAKANEGKPVYLISPQGEKNARRWEVTLHEGVRCEQYFSLSYQFVGVRKR